MTFSDYDSTVVDPMPKATKTYEEMEADTEAKLDEFIESDASDAAETEEGTETEDATKTN